MTRKDFASLLKDYRRRENLTQEAAASFFGVSLRTWQNWEIARNMPRGFGLRALILALGHAHPRKGRRSHSAPAGTPEAKPRIQNAMEPSETSPVLSPDENAHSSLEAHLL